MPLDYDFSKNATVETLDGVPDKYKPVYVEITEGDDAGKFKINDSFNPLLGDYAGAVNTLDTVRGDKKKASDEAAQRRIALKAFNDIMEEFGIDEESRTADGLKAYIAELVGKAKNGDELKINLDKVRKEMGDKHAQDLAAKDTELAAKDKALEKHLIGDVATRALAEAKGSVELLLPHIQSHCKVVQTEGGDYEVRVLDSAGDIRFNGAGQPMSVTDFVTEMKTKDAYARAFESEAPGGGGSNPRDTGGKPPVRKTDGDKTPIDRISAGLAKRKTGRG